MLKRRATDVLVDPQTIARETLSRDGIADNSLPRHVFEENPTILPSKLMREQIRESQERNVATKASQGSSDQRAA